MKYIVQTGGVCGVSEASYEGTPFAPLFGTCQQGSWASPAVWLSLMVLLLNTIEKVTPELIRFSNPSGTLTHQRLVDAFVDDTPAIGFTDYSGKPMDEIISLLQRVAQTWEKLLHDSGGSLNLNKCIWFVRLDFCGLEMARTSRGTGDLLLGAGTTVPVAKQEGNWSTMYYQLTR